MSPNVLLSYHGCPLFSSNSFNRQSFPPPFTPNPSFHPSHHPSNAPPLLSIPNPSIHSSTTPSVSASLRASFNPAFVAPSFHPFPPMMSSLRCSSVLPSATESEDEEMEWRLLGARTEPGLGGEFHRRTDAAASGSIDANSARCH